MLTPVTPVTMEGMTSLYERIKQDSSASDEHSRQRQQKRIDKLVRFTQISYAKQSLLQDHNWVLLEVQKTAQLCRARNSVILKKGEGRVFEFEHREEARLDRDARDKATAEKSKGKRGRKRKAPIQDETEDRPSPASKAKVSKSIQNQEGVSWRAPVATMW
jgi:hypothetical protein